MKTLFYIYTALMLKVLKMLHEAHFISSLMCKIGLSFTKAEMKETGALLAGEMSGHMFFVDRYFGYDDAVYASCRMVECLAVVKLGDPNVTFRDYLRAFLKPSRCSEFA